MAIRMMVSATEPGAFQTTYQGKDIWMVETHAGQVYATYERNGYDDSDFYARVWDDEAGMSKDIMFASTRGWTYPNSAVVDITDENKAKLEAWLAGLRAKWAAEKAAAEAATPARGKRAKTTRNVRGKNAIEAGVTGTIFWVGPDKFSRYGELRVGFAADDGREKVFLSASAVEVLSSAEMMEAA